MMNDISINAIVDRFLHYTCLSLSVLAFSQDPTQFPLAMAKSLIGCGQKPLLGMDERSPNNYFNNGSPKKLLWGNNPVMDHGEASLWICCLPKCFVICPKD